MKVTYIKHSCFTVELEHSAFVFDYYKGDLNKFGKDKTVWVFISHKHKDHFNPKIFELAGEYENISFILPNDMKMSEKYMEKLKVPARAREQLVYVRKNQELSLGDIQIKTLNSTDEGVAFIVKAEGTSLYHAGDLNWWSWKGETEEEYRDMAGRFKKEIEKIKGEHFDAAFLPLDPRQEDRFWWGFDYFMRATHTDRAFPMHLWGEYSFIDKLMETDCAGEYRDKIVKITKKEEVFMV